MPSYQIEPLDMIKTERSAVHQIENTGYRSATAPQPDIDTEFVFSNSRFWRIFRLAFNLTILLLLIGLLAFIVAIVIIHPSCKPLKELNWWENTLIYRVDLEKLDSGSNSRLFVLKNNSKYFDEVKTNVVWLSDIIDLNRDFTTIKPTYGTVTDLKELIGALHDKGIKVVIDFIPNHTTDISPWFRNSLTDPDYKDYYVWTDTPNNWRNKYDGGEAWERESNGRYYLHQFKKNERELNYRNPKVVDELFNALRYWLDLGVDGFNLVNVPYLFEDYLLRDESILVRNIKLPYLNFTKSFVGNWFVHFKNEYTQNQRETFLLVAAVKEFLLEYSKKNQTNERILVAELDSRQNSSDSELIRKYYGNKGLAGFDLLVFQTYPTDSNSNKYSIDSRTYTDNIVRLTKLFEQYGKQPLWTVDSNVAIAATNDSSVLFLQASFIALPGTSIIHLNNDFYKNVFTGNYSENGLFRKIGELRHGSNAIKLGNVKYQTKFKSCDYIEVMRYADTQTTYTVHFNLDKDNKDCTSSSKLESSFIKSAKYANAFSYTDFATNMKLADKLKKEESIKFNSKGLANVALPRNSFLILSLDYTPPDIDEIL